MEKKQKWAIHFAIVRVMDLTRMGHRFNNFAAESSKSFHFDPSQILRQNLQKNKKVLQ